MRKRLFRKLHHYFLPHESNNYRAKSIHTSTLIFYIIILLFIQTSSPILRLVDPNILGYATDITIERILYLVNQERSKENLAPLTLSSELATAATKKATDMFAKNYWAHISPTGVSPWSFITGSGYQYIYAGENLAKSFNTSEEVVAAWMRSPTHRANILKKEYADIGLAVLNGQLVGEETTLVVQEFGTRVRKNIPVLVEAPVKPISTATPTPIPVEIASAGNTIQGNSALNQPVNELSAKDTTKPKLSIFSWQLSKTVSVVLAEFLLVVLLIDGIYIAKHKTARITGHSLAHVVFLAALLGAMGAAGVGVIL